MVLILLIYLSYLCKLVQSYSTKTECLSTSFARDESALCNQNWHTYRQSYILSKTTPLIIMVGLDINGRFESQNQFYVSASVFVILLCYKRSINTSKCTFEVHNLRNFDICLYIDDTAITRHEMNVPNWNYLKSEHTLMISESIESHKWYSRRMTDYLWSHTSSGRWLEISVNLTMSGSNFIVGVIKTKNSKLYDKFRLKYEVETLLCKRPPYFVFRNFYHHSIEDKRNRFMSTTLLIEHNPSQCLFTNWTCDLIVYQGYSDGRKKLNRYPFRMSTLDLTVSRRYRFPSYVLNASFIAAETVYCYDKETFYLIHQMCQTNIIWLDKLSCNERLTSIDTKVKFSNTNKFVSVPSLYYSNSRFIFDRDTTETFQFSLIFDPTHSAIISPPVWYLYKFVESRRHFEISRHETLESFQYSISKNFFNDTVHLILAAVITTNLQQNFVSIVEVACSATNNPMLMLCHSTNCIAFNEKSLVILFDDRESVFKLICANMRNRISIQADNNVGELDYIPEGPSAYVVFRFWHVTRKDYYKLSGSCQVATSESARNFSLRILPLKSSDDVVLDCRINKERLGVIRDELVISCASIIQPLYVTVWGQYEVNDKIFGGMVLLNLNYREENIIGSSKTVALKFLPIQSGDENKLPLTVSVVGKNVSRVLYIQLTEMNFKDLNETERDYLTERLIDYLDYIETIISRCNSERQRISYDPTYINADVTPEHVHKSISKSLLSFLKIVHMVIDASILPEEHIKILLNKYFEHLLTLDSELYGKESYIQKIAIFEEILNKPTFLNTECFLSINQYIEMLGQNVEITGFMLFPMLSLCDKLRLFYSSISKNEELNEEVARTINTGYLATNNFLVRTGGIIEQNLHRTKSDCIYAKSFFACIGTHGIRKTRFYATRFNWNLGKNIRLSYLYSNTILVMNVGSKLLSVSNVHVFIWRMTVISTNRTVREISNPNKTVDIFVPLVVTSNTTKYVFKCTTKEVHEFTLRFISSSLSKFLLVMYVDIPLGTRFISRILISDSSDFSNYKTYQKEIRVTERIHYHNVSIRSMVSYWMKIRFSFKFCSKPSRAVSSYVRLYQAGCHCLNGVDLRKKSNFKTGYCDWLDSKYYPTHIQLNEQIACRCRFSANNAIYFEPLDFQKAKKLLFLKYAIHSYMLVSLINYLVLLAYVLRKDREDMLRDELISLNDNDSSAKFIYQLTLFTGVQRDASTSSDIYVMLIGNKANDVPHCLNENENDRKFLLQRGSIDSFIITSHIDLGDITAVHLWIQEPSSRYSSWYLRHCIVTDLKRKKTFYFCCYSWLINRGGKVAASKVFPRSPKIDYLSFGHLFISSFCWLLCHYHCVISIFKKQQLNHNSRIHRLNIFFFICASQLLYIMSSTVHVQLFKHYAMYDTKIFNFYALFDFLSASIISSLISCILYFIVNSIAEFSNRYKYEFECQLYTRFTPTDKIDPLHLITSSLISIKYDYEYYKNQKHLWAAVNRFNFKNPPTLLKYQLNDFLLQRLENEIEKEEKVIRKYNWKKLIDGKYFHNVISREQVLSSKEKQTSHASEDSSSTNACVMENEPFSEKFFPFLKQTNKSCNAEVLTTSKTEYEDNTTQDMRQKLDYIKLDADTNPKKYTIRNYKLSKCSIYAIHSLAVVIIIPILLMIFKEDDTYFAFRTLFAIAFHLLSIVFTCIINTVFIIMFGLLNASLFKITDEVKFIPKYVKIRRFRLSELEKAYSVMKSEIRADARMDSMGLQMRIKERLIENSLIDAFRDLIGYVLFLVVVLLIANPSLSTIGTTRLTYQASKAFFENDGIFHQLESNQQFFYWISYILDRRLFENKLDFDCGKSVCTFSRTNHLLTYIVKFARIRQIRVKRYKCPELKIGRQTITFNKTCLTYLHNLNASYFINDSFSCSGWDKKFNDCECVQFPWKAQKHQPHYTLFSSYQPTAFYTMLLSSKDQFAPRCDRKKTYIELINRRWIDKNTHTLLLDGNIYNPSTDFLTTFELSTENLPSGGLKRSISMWVVRANINGSENESKTSLIYILFIVYTFSITIYILNECVQFYQLSRAYRMHGVVAYLTAFSNWIDMSLIVLSLSYFIFDGFQRDLKKKNVEHLFNTSYYFLNYKAIGLNEHIIRTILGLMIYVSILKLLNLLKFNPKTFLLTETLRISFKGIFVILSFYVMNFVIFAIIGMRLFRRYEKFRTLKEAFLTSFKLLSKGKGSQELYEMYSTKSALWFFGLWVISNLILQNFLISYVVENFASVRKNHVVSDEERVFGLLIAKILKYFQVKDE